MVNAKVSIDPYFEGMHGYGAAAWDDRPPAVAAPSQGGATLMHLYVPSERTEIDYGAGAVPGIRMATDPHVHLTARKTLSTISLGNPGGEGISSGDLPGISIFTAGAKSETIEQCVKEYYKNAKSELIKGLHTQTLLDEHYFDVSRNATYKYGANRFEHTVGNKKETIDGESHVEVKGNAKWTYKGPKFTHTWGFSHDIYGGEKLTVFGGLSTAINVGATIAVNLAAASTTNIGARLDTSLAYQQSFVLGNKLETVWRNSISITKSAKVSVDNYSISKAKFTYKDSGQTLKKARLRIHKIDGADISSTALKVIK
jgi:hypothetical protein